MIHRCKVLHSLFPIPLSLEVEDLQLEVVDQKPFQVEEVVHFQFLQHLPECF
jgi:hypothetical protein